MPVARKWEFSESAVNALPVFGFVVGIALGLGMCLVATIREVVFIVLGCVILGVLLWFLSAWLVVGVLAILDVPEDTVDAIMDWVGPIAFALGPILGLIGALAFGFDKVGDLRARMKSGQIKVPLRR